MEQDKDKNAEKCANVSNLSKADKIICQELMQARADDTIDKLRYLHLHGDLDFERQFWTSRDDTRELTGQAKTGSPSSTSTSMSKRSRSIFSFRTDRHCAPDRWLEGARAHGEDAHHHDQGWRFPQTLS